MNPLDFIGRWKLILEGLAILALIAGICYSAHEFIQHEQQIGYDKAQAEYQAKLLEATQAARDKEAALNKQLKEAQNAATQREQTIRTLAAAAGNASSGLRNTLDNISRGVPAATIEALRQSTTTLTALFADCSRRYQGMAEIADRHASDSRTLDEAWPK